MELIIIFIFFLLTLIGSFLIFWIQKKHMLESDIEKVLDIYEKQLQKSKELINKKNRQIDRLEHKILSFNKKLK